MLGTLLDLLAGVVILMSLLWFGWLGVAGLISPSLVGGRSRFGLLGGSVFGCAVCLYLMTAITEAEPEPEPELVAVSAPAPAPTPAPAPDPPSLPDTPITEWIVESNVAAAAGEFGRLRLGVSCEGDDWIVALGVVENLTGADGFRNRPTRADWKWDGRGPYRYDMSQRLVADQYVLSTRMNAGRVVSRLRGREVVEIHVETLLGGTYNDILGLEGAAPAFDSLDCEEPDTAQRRGVPAPSFDTDTEAGIVATIVQSGIGASVETILSLMAGYEPTRSRSGEQRRFTYRFDDGSGLVLVFVPPGGSGTGLVLDDIIVR